jgi:hypothetical protein
MFWLAVLSGSLEGLRLFELVSYSYGADQLLVKNQLPILKKIKVIARVVSLKSRSAFL